MSRKSKYLRKQEIADLTFDDKFDQLEALITEPREAPVTNHFVPGLYAREILIKKGSWITSKIHKTTHLFMVSKGSLRVWMDGVDKVIKAPCTGITQAGTRRIAFALEDTVWTTFHPNPTDTQDLDEIENMVIEYHDNPHLKKEIPWHGQRS